MVSASKSINAKILDSSSRYCTCVRMLVWALCLCSKRTSQILQCWYKKLSLAFPAYCAHRPLAAFDLVAWTWPIDYR